MSAEAEMPKEEAEKCHWEGALERVLVPSFVRFEGCGTAGAEEVDAGCSRHLGVDLRRKNAVSRGEEVKGLFFASS